jgi:hypothetical protein
MDSPKCVFSPLTVIEGDVQTYIAFAVNVRALTVCFLIFFCAALPAVQGEPFSQEDTECTQEGWMILMSYLPSVDKAPCSSEEVVNKR